MMLWYQPRYAGVGAPRGGRGNAEQLEASDGRLDGQPHLRAADPHLDISVSTVRLRGAVGGQQRCSRADVVACWTSSEDGGGDHAAPVDARG